ncbi:acetoin utilization AcuB family protein [Tenuibacillus multivorans]|uniref:Acetoin utilization protein AcuB n=1 Tax=Tenuibacillus multivorans TaxID=237069 RepID=A0A1H0EFD2_9BACI|nr:acetoin utilization AcuB family protein [Tenuibacillus multivorans]GEL77178.1 acetoin utilization protein AcuB [Tenuibacillus multivorans]SDN81164.1 acetoin utilization protein AcuB [Tenuibacillus multivorans]
MLVEEIMKKEVITLLPNNTIKEALELLNHHHIRHIPIVNEDHNVVGIISDRDIRDAAPSTLEEKQNQDILNHNINSIMTSPVITVHPLDFIEEIASVFYEHEIACVPVTKDQQLIGIVTEKDLLYTLIQLTGIHEQSSQIEIKVPNRAGILPNITKIIGERKTNISSVFIYPDQQDRSQKIIVLRIQTMNPMPLIDELKEQGYDVLWPNIPGLRQ